MATEREKEREAELESAMYTNCLLLGLDPSVLGGGGSPRVGQFRHSNPRMGEHLLYFLLSSLRGPVQTSKDFDKVWPLFDPAQSRDFRKIVQGIISELESQGALPRSNSRVSSLATCSGVRFVELLWQLSVHTLREVHRRTFGADVASNPLPSSLTDVSYLHAAALLPVTKAKIALERRKFLKNANTAVHRQATWSNLAHEMTSEFRGLCAEEAYLQQELEKLQDLRNKAKLDGELWDDRVSSSSGQNSHLVSKATRLWESLLSRKSQHEVLSSGPIEDLIAHREHRYRISGSSLLAAMGASSNVPYSDVLSVRPGDLTPPADDRVCEQNGSNHFRGNNEANDQADDRSGRVHPTVDVAEVLRRWTHALQRVHKQSLYLAKANDGEGPVLLKSASDTDSSGHAESLAATLAEHRQHLISIQGLINQLKEAVPTMQKSISELTEEVNSISSGIPMNEFNGRTASHFQAQSSGRTLEHSADEVLDVSSKLASVQLEKASTSPALKLPHLFSLTPNSSGKGVNVSKRLATATQPSQAESLNDGKRIDQPLPNDYMDNSEQEGISYVQNLRRSVREAALSRASSNAELAQENNTDNSSRHFFTPLSTGAVFLKEEDAVPNKRKQRLVFPPPEIKLDTVPEILNGGLDHKPYDSQNMFYDFDGAQDHVLSPLLLMESPFFNDTYEDLLAPLSETDAALMEK